jgi:hypothetical protein
LVEVSVWKNECWWYDGVLLLELFRELVDVEPLVDAFLAGLRRRHDIGAKVQKISRENRKM